MQAEFYTISKRANSTKQPGTAEATFNITLKQPTSIHEPTLIIRASSFAYNYCYIGDFSTYYFVRDVRSIANDLWEVDLTVDALATYKGAILSTTQFVERSARFHNPQIADELIPFTGVTNVTRTDLGDLNLSIVGRYFVSVISNEGRQFTSTYVLTTIQMQQFVSFIVDQSFWDSMKQVWGINPYDAVLSCYWLPVDAEAITEYGTVADFVIFDVSVGFQALRLDDLAPRYNSKTTITIPWQFTDFRNSAPYTTMQVFFPGVGLIDMDVNNLRGCASLRTNYTLDLMTGDLAIIFEGLTSDERVRPIQSASGNVKVNFPVAQVQSALNVGSIVGAASGAVSAIGGFMSGNIASGVSSVLSGASSLLATRPVNANGAFSSSAGFGYSYARGELVLYYKVAALEPSEINNVYGRPLCRVMSLSSMAGYVKCVNASIEPNGATLEEIEAINSYMNNGFFIE